MTSTYKIHLNNFCKNITTVYNNEIILRKRTMTQQSEHLKPELFSHKTCEIVLNVDWILFHFFLVRKEKKTCHPMGLVEIKHQASAYRGNRTQGHMVEAPRSHTKSTSKRNKKTWTPACLSHPYKSPFKGRFQSDLSDSDTSRPVGVVSRHMGVASRMISDRLLPPPGAAVCPTW